ncbi:MAG: DUF1385 domain-containing protein [Clostridiales bacterium]|nr:DUF1385 domain-containing protein [Clostridiales bacterium]
MKKKTKKKQTFASVGGQALMEGILMRGPAGTSMALRLPDGSIETSKKTVRQLKDKYKLLGWPFVRGIVGFIETMSLGYKSLMESAEKTTLNSEEFEAESKFEKWLSKYFGPKLMEIVGFISALLGMALAFLLFFYLPTFLFNLINHNDALVMWKTVVEGLIRIVIFLVYMVLVAQMKDIKRLYMYHGAEHKAIFCYENSEELTVENVRKQSRFHPRCGTSFMFVMIILSILISSLIYYIFPQLKDMTLVWMLVKLSIMPIILGLGYEFIKYAGCHQNLFVKVLSAPGLWMQRITTKEPTDDIIEVAIAALKAVLPEYAHIMAEEKTQEDISDPANTNLDD